MSRRKGQNPKVRIGKRADGTKYYFFQYWIDIPGKEDRKRMTVVLGPANELTWSEAERKKLEFISKLQLNSSEDQIPSPATFADAVRYYREDFAPRMLRASTFSIADGHIRNHLEAYWNDIPIDHIRIDRVNQWAWKKRQEGISWSTIRDSTRTMQRILSAFTKSDRPPFSQKGLNVPERDKLQLRISDRQRVSFSWAQAELIAQRIQNLDGLGVARREQYATLVLVAAASGLRSSELLALRINDIDFEARTIRVDESSDQRTKGRIGLCKNTRAYRTVGLHDAEGRKAMESLRRFVGSSPPDELIFRSRRGGPLLQTTVLNQGLYPALQQLGLPKGGLHGFRRGCNRRWELAKLSPAVIRQQMGHTSERMTAHYSGEIPLEDVRSAFSQGSKRAESENKENGAAA